jgi:chemotaxis protein MotB
MFWLKRWKQNDESDPYAWALSYGDLVTLLLAVFVLIASMSEIRRGPASDGFRRAVQAEFGFSVPDETSMPRSGRAMTLLEHLERLGLATADPATVLEPVLDETLCGVFTEPGKLIIRISGAAAFDPFSASLKPAAERIVEQVAGCVAEAKGRVEIWGHGDEANLPAEASFRDVFDLSYQRAHAVAGVLIRSGIPRHRLSVAARGAGDPVIRVAGPGRGANRRIDIIVYAAPAA